MQTPNSVGVPLELGSGRRLEVVGGACQRKLQATQQKPNCLGRTFSSIRTLGTFLVRTQKEARDALLETGGRESLLGRCRKFNKIVACSDVGRSKSKRQIWISDPGRGGHVAQCGEHNGKEPALLQAEC